MLKKNCRGIHGGNTSNHWARICDACQSTVCSVYCLADLAYLCNGCDARIHGASPEASRHERTSVCEACERAPAAFLCKADAASLCTTCDSEIHSANSLARRHQRVPVLPLPCVAYGTPSANYPSGLVMRPNGVAAKTEFLVQDDDEETIHEEGEDETASWLLLDPVKKNNSPSKTIGQLFGEEFDEYFDLEECSPCQDDHLGNEDNNVVPIQFGKIEDQSHSHSFQLGMEYESSNDWYDYPPSKSHMVSISSMDVGVVPQSMMSEVSVSHSRPPKGTIDLFSSPPIPLPTQLSPMEREARVLRYKEKKKARKFEKTIRYASRKAYAEIRPRIKGRFAKRTEAATDQMFATRLVEEGGYGIVPSF